MFIKKLFAPMGALWAKHDGGILTAVTVGGTVAAVAIAIKDRPRYEEILWQAEEDGVDNIEKARRLLPATLPLMIAAGSSIGAALWNHHRTGKKLSESTETIASLIRAYSISKSLEGAYKERLGEDSSKEVEREVYNKKVWEVKDGEADSILYTGHGDDLFYDAWRGKKFYSDINYIKRVVNDLNYRLLSEMWISLNEFYQDMDMPVSDCGRDYGWNIDYGTIDIDITAELDENQKPYTVIRFKNEPQLRYQTGWR